MEERSEIPLITSLSSRASSAIPWLEEYYWLVDLLRSVVLIALVIAGLVSHDLFLRLLFLGIGTFLIFDGILTAASGWFLVERESARMARFALGLLGIAVGIGVIVAHTFMAVALVVLLGGKLIVHGISNIIQSVRSLTLRQGIGRVQVGEGERWLWLAGVARIVGGVIVMAAYLIVIPVYSFLLMAYFTGDALFNLYSAWLKSRPARAKGYIPLTPMAAPDAEIPGVADQASTTALRSIVFVRRGGANGFGHIAFAFEWPAGYFTVGSVENPGGAPIAKPAEAGFWLENTHDPVGAVQRQVRVYDEFKVNVVRSPKPDVAWNAIGWVRTQSYSVARRNCADAAYDALRAFGVERLIDTAQKNVPNEWYDGLPGESYRISEHPFIPLRPGVIPQVLITPAFPDEVKPPPWRNSGPRALYEIDARVEYMNERALQFMAWLIAHGHVLMGRLRSARASRA